ncbi:MAG TPA: NAD(P)H-dependent oxidoreductase subunit E [Candidatus Binatia bacterium]|nr:NAD(P)H-dependent oxidoreductase subunit E [Candidatus Binatia bacterium]
MSQQATTTTAAATGPVSFSPQALAEYHEILTHYPERRAALMTVLWLAQREFGWISPAVEDYVAKLMDLPRSWVEGVVSFYTMYYRRPMGKNHLQVCTNLSCYLRGAEDIYNAISQRLDIGHGQTTPDGKFSLDRVECLGSCGTAPMLQLGDHFHENLTVARVLEMLDRLERGEKL